jgi:hypothetical protein
MAKGAQRGVEQFCKTAGRRVRLNGTAWDVTCTKMIGGNLVRSV